MNNLPLNKPLRILLSTNALILLSGAMLGPIYALFVKDIGGDLMDASIAGGLFALAAGLTTLISGKYSDRIKENELVVALGYLLMGIGFFLYLFVHSVAFLFVVQIIIGLGEAIYSPPFDAVYSKHLDGQKAGSQWGVWESMNYFSVAVGAVLGGLIVTVFSFQALFVIIGSLCVISAVYIYHLPRKVL
ncbi:MFS transporter [Candidatus Dojkabacteria bacterium]|uniref:MFS transporter n=1 Tax=Candidatus Dojkabacteria bacterium TaxID=2099670 RepID=A0A955L303_9BACT|nr:MFS transporter [Candidatus Dojkabacteria bacterium]